MIWKDIPSLASLRAFEATARAGTFSAAARELNVTHAAIAQHVRGLEDFFATELVFRQGRGMNLTDAGQRLSAALADGFGAIALGVADLRAEQQGRPLRVSITPSFAENWLMPRLGRFWRAHPTVEVELKPTERLVDLRRDDVDMAVRFGRGDWPGVHSTPLTAARTVVVGAPSLVGDNAEPTLTDLKTYWWALDRNQTEANLWASDHGFSFDALNTNWFDTNSLALSAIRSGLAVGLQNLALVQPDIDRGTLRALTEPEEDGTGYFIVTVPGRDTAATRKFTSWLLKEAA